MDGSCSDDSGIEEERAGGGAGPTGGGPAREQEDRQRIHIDDHVYLECWRSIHAEDVTIRLSTSLPILEGCSSLNVTCGQCENGKSISPIDSAQATMAYDADTDSDLARPRDGKHPNARHATPGMRLRSATHRRIAGHVVAHPGPSDSE
jgi:hypothetical protein